MVPGNVISSIRIRCRPVHGAQTRLEGNAVVVARGAWQRTGVRGSINQHCRIADRPRAQEKLFKLAIDAIAHRTDADAVGVNFCADAARAVVDRETHRHRLQRRADHVAHRVKTGNACVATGSVRRDR